MSKNNIDYIGADLHHFYLPNFSCKIDLNTFDLGYRIFSQALRYLTGCNASIAFIIEYAIILLMILLIARYLLTSGNLSTLQIYSIAVCLSFLSLEYFMTGSRQYYGFILIILCVSSSLGKNKVKIFPMIIGLIASSFHSTALLCFLSIVFLYTSFNFIIKRPLSFFILLSTFVMFLTFSLSNGFSSTNFYAQRIYTYSSLSGLSGDFTTINKIRFVVITLFTLYCFQFYRKNNEKFLLLVTINAVTWLLIVYILIYMGFVGYLTASRLSAIPVDLFLFFNLISKNKIIWKVSFIIMNILIIKGINDYINYGHSDTSILEVFIFSFWGI